MKTFIHLNRVVNVIEQKTPKKKKRKEKLHKLLQKQHSDQPVFIHIKLEIRNINGEQINETITIAGTKKSAEYVIGEQVLM